MTVKKYIQLRTAIEQPEEILEHFKLYLVDKKPVTPYIRVEIKVIEYCAEFKSERMEGKCQKPN